jgi:exopolyphosphatase/guanosine-5'-triphosphate,3'-diphosphate pyrophosphatase
MEEQDYPLRVLHHYVMPSGRAVKICRVVARLSRKSLDKMKAVPKRRAEALPYGAAVMEAMIESLGLKEVVVSAYGLREGVLQRKLKPEEAAKDPLIAFASDVNGRESRTVGHAGELFQWMQPLFAKETERQSRIREAICLFSDVSWRRHPDDRALGAFAQVLRGNYGGADHHERALMATAIYHRYAGDEDFPKETGIISLLGEDGAITAEQIGLAARLGFGISGALEGELPQTSLHMSRETIVLKMPDSKKALLGETVQKRLDELGEAFGRRMQTSTS